MHPVQDGTHPADDSPIGGFALGPTAAGLLADHVGWGSTWLVVAAVFATASAAGALLSRSIQRAAAQ